MGRRGLRPTWVEDPATREPVVGLVCRSDGRHAANANPNKTFGKDRRDVIRRFYAWQSRQQGQTVTVRETGPLSDIVRADWEDWREHHPDADARQYYAEGLATNESIKFKRIQEAAFWEIVATVIRDNPKLAARKTGIEELAYHAIDQLHALGVQARVRFVHQHEFERAEEKGHQ